MITLKNPYYMNIEGQYTIENNGEILYSGFANAAALDENGLDIMPVIRQIVKPIDYKFENTSKPIQIEPYNLNVIGNNNYDLKVFWNYDNDGQLSDGIISYGIQDYVYVGQYEFMTFYNLENEYENWYSAGCGGNQCMGNMIPLNGDGCYKCSKISPNVSWDYLMDTFKYKGNQITIKYTIKKCIPDNTVTLYYINMKGGLSWVHCNKKNVVENVITRNQITNVSTINNYNIQHYNNYTLNTDFLTDDQSILLQDLFKSPKVWLFDYKNDQSIPVVITDNRITIKNRANDKLFNYTIKCRDAKTENIYA